MTTGQPRRATTLPTGTVTFLFTDIEGSTRLVQDLGDQYGNLLADHCRILRDAIERADGIELGTEGDSFFAVFPSAVDAVAASAAAQRELAGHGWPGDAEVRVRMGLHTGEGTLGGDNYIGLDVHRAARIANAAHGGQVVLSDATRSLAESSLPPGVALRTLGAHRLKDLANSERLFQLDIAGLSIEFPALRTLDARPNNLPVQLTSFIGREAEIAAVGELLELARLVTLTGPGGTGKTRLALQVAAERLSRYADGAFVVELAPISDPALVLSAIAGAIGVREAANRPLAETLKESIHDRELLLVLDNFEQILGAASRITDLLTGAPRLRVLVTSRAVLHVHGEHELPVPPLRIPDPAHLPRLEALSQFEGVALFLERAMAARPDFAVTPQSAPAIAEIVARLDGLPLAIELAAAKAKLLGAEAILGRLGSRLAFLGGGARDLPARQQTLRQAIDWSYGLLTPPEQAFARRLGVFVGGWTVEAADSIGEPAELGLDAFEALAALVDQSLVRREEVEHGEPRFLMLETIREFSLERLDAAGETADLRRRHARHFVELAEQAEPDLTRDPEAINRVGHDHDNYRAVLSWAIETEEAELGLRLGFALWRFWHQRAYLNEGRQWFERLLAVPGAEVRTAARARGVTGAAGIAYWRNDYAAAEAWYAEAESIYRELGDRVGLADALYNAGTVAAIRGDMPAVFEKLGEGAAIGRELGDDAIVERFMVADGYMAFMTDDLERARSLLEQGLELTERRGDRMAIATGNHTVAQVARLQGRLDDAANHYLRSLTGLHELGDVASLTEPLQGLAAVAVATGRAELGVRLLGANAAIRERVGGGPPPEWLRLGDPLADARAMLDEATYARAWERGLAMTADEAVADAMAMTPAEAPTS
ncbi:MAG: adenylate/guanylate cyclase domain-containing protein [Chloroflexi bacterium]|nr:MAG: adenylate/guanylate cyclase domain-containing protein [Chloroflexota bacterium]